MATDRSVRHRTQGLPLSAGAVIQVAFQCLASLALTLSSSFTYLAQCVSHRGPGKPRTRGTHGYKTGPFVCTAAHINVRPPDS
jgi:hypothetical protein